MKCPSCGKTINGDSVFCSYCGMPIKDDYKTRQQIIRNKKEEQKRRRQEAADAMWAEVESHRKVPKPVQHQMNHDIGTARKKSASVRSRFAIIIFVIIIIILYLLMSRYYPRVSMFVNEWIKNILHAILGV